MSPALAGRFFTTSATWEAQSIPLVFNKNNENINDSLVAQLVKNPPAILGTQVQSLDWEDPLEKEIPNPVF